MQRGFLLLLTLFALYACASSVPHTSVNKKPVSVTPAAVKITPVAPVTEISIPPKAVTQTPLPSVSVAEQPPVPVIAAKSPSDVSPASGKSLPHIALLLPLTSTVFSVAAEAVQQGFLAAANQGDRALPVRVYGCADEGKDIIEMYHLAIANGARAVVGPLTRNGVNALATEQNIPVLTLTLNLPEDQPAKQLYYFGMAAEAEARQVAQLAKQQGLHNAIVVSTRAQLSQRLQFAFESEWHNLGGKILREIEFSDDPSVFSNIAEPPETVIFLATNAEKASLIRPYLPVKLPTWATSQIFVGNNDTLTNYDLNGIQFVDMPWLLQPDHPAGMNYARAIPPLSSDMERLYALGIDAFRLIQLMLVNKIDTALPLDGVSGEIRLTGHIFQRKAVAAEFQQGQARLSSEASALPSLLFPHQEVNKP